MAKLNAKGKVLGKAFARAYVDNGLNGVKAMQELRPHKTYTAAKTKAAQVLALPETQNEIQHILEKKGITKGFLGDRLLDGLQANALETCDGAVQLSQAPDYNVRHKYFVTALKLHDLLDGDSGGTKNVILYVDQRKDTEQQEQ